MTTYWTGIVNESDLCHSGGFPGPLRNLLGIWAEEIDCLNDGERNLVQGLAGNEGGLQGPYQVRHLCELIHAESARPLATYRDDFYAGRPAVTVNHFGKGRHGMSPHATTRLSSAISSRSSAGSWPYRGRSTASFRRAWSRRHVPMAKRPMFSCKTTARSSTA